MKKKDVVLIVILLLFNLIFYFGLRWVSKNIGFLSLDEIIYYLKGPTTGTSKSMINDVVNTCVIPILIIIILLIIILIFVNKHNKDVEIKIFKKQIKTNIALILKKILIYINVILLIIQIIYMLDKFKDFWDYLRLQQYESNFIEENYVDPRKVNIEFKEKKNLIYIYLESTEATYMDLENGGLQKENIIPELTQLSKENTSFSNTDKLGGAYQAFGTNWTIAAMVSHTSGIPLKVSESPNGYPSGENFLPGIYNLGDILYKNGYKNMLMVGSDARFGGRKIFFTQHGNYEIKDYYTAIEDGIIDQNHYEFWGMEDSYLFEYAKKELINLSKGEQPFNFTLLTVNTHFPDGYLEDSCKKNFNNGYANAIACSSKQVDEFIKWIMSQDFYDNTTIVIVGDHLTMAENPIVKGEEYKRTIYNTFINSSVESDNTKREFTTLDLFPTTLASIGAEIENNKLGLGVNLYSNEKTLVEKYSLDYVNDELTKKSNYYKKQFLD